MSLKNVTYFKADWTTRPCDAALAEYGRSGVHLPVIQTGADHADVLPQLLTKGVLDALEL